METLFTEIETYLDKEVIKALITKYFRAIDDKCADLDIIKDIFTTDAKITRPDGSVIAGHKGILEAYQHSIEKFKVTQHQTSDYIINVAYGLASVRANTMAMHMWADSDATPLLNGTYFYNGVVVCAQAVRTKEKWQLQELSFRSVWRLEDGVHKVANFLKQRSA